MCKNNRQAGEVSQFLQEGTGGFEVAGVLRDRGSLQGRGGLQDCGGGRKTQKQPRMTWGVKLRM